MLGIIIALAVGEWSLGAAAMAFPAQGPSPSAQPAPSPAAPTTPPNVTDISALLRRQAADTSSICALANTLIFACTRGFCYQYVVGADDKYFGCCQANATNCQITTACVPATAASSSTGRYHVLTCGGTSSECATYTWPSINVKGFTCAVSPQAGIITITDPVAVSPSTIITQFGAGPDNASPTEKGSASSTKPSADPSPAIYDDIEPGQVAGLAVGVVIFVIVLLLIVILPSTRFCGPDRLERFRAWVSKEPYVLRLESTPVTQVDLARSSPSPGTDHPAFILNTQQFHASPPEVKVQQMEKTTHVISGGESEKNANSSSLDACCEERDLQDKDQDKEG